MSLAQVDDKPAFRSAMRQLRRALHAEAPDAPVQAALRFAEAKLGPFKAAAIYHPCGTEIDPFPLAAMLERQGTKIVLPVVVELDSPLVFREMSEGGDLPPDKLGIPCPGPDAAEVRPDLVVTPLLAFDRAGGRLGQGGGYYDRTIQALRREGEVFVMGLAYAGQELAQIPMDELDQPLDGVLTERGFHALGEA